MSEEDLLSQEEKDALIKGVESGDVDTETPEGDGEARAYNFASRDLRLLESLPRLQTVSELFTVAATEAIAKMFRSEPVVVSEPMSTRGQQDFIESLPSLCNLSVCRMKPLPGQWLFVLEAKLLYILVDRYFGGKGLAPASERAKQFTPIEDRLAAQVSELLLKELAIAFEDIAELEPIIDETEHNPDYLTLPVSQEPVIQLTFNINFVEDAGACHLVLPYAMFETIKDRLNIAVDIQAPKFNDEWQPQIKSRLRQASVSLQAALDEVSLTVGQILDLVPGDVVPIKSPDNVTVKVGGQTLFLGKFGVSDGHNAVKITQSGLQ
ncbi:MAG: flagellar motor switch protein FliM [Gammaproteobacteria bacterium TMED182]|nr:flagellar motor switch protein FliM [Gammaproteobacteria bacterium]RPG50552.1 MAG: flagellar motor switch protein FliM [Gammaproteobacteria bacterium TMED182]